jgi:hypothetical protein
MPIEPGELVEAVEEVQHQENDAEQHDAAADETMAQITKQFDPRFSARDMRPGRYDQRPDNHLLDVRKYFLGDRLDMFGIERQPFGPDLRHLFSLQR